MHAPPHYSCPFCAVARGEFTSPGLLTTKEDVILQTGSVLAFIASHWWPNNPGHVLIVPTKHFENIYELPNDIAAKIHAAARDIALAMKQTHACPGISTRQHNEPAGGQDVWHYHLHVFPRFVEDGLYANHHKKYLTSPAQRKPFSDRLKAALVPS